MLSMDKLCALLHFFGGIDRIVLVQEYAEKIAEIAQAASALNGFEKYFTKRQLMALNLARP